MKAILAIAIVAALGTAAHAEPSDRHLVYGGLGMALPDYALGVTLHEGSHALAARLVGARVLELHLWPGKNPATGHFQFGWTRVSGLESRGERLFFLIAPKITDLVFLAGYGVLFATDSFPDNRWWWLTVQVLATGFWVDFAKDVLVFHRFNDEVRFLSLLGLDNELERLPARLLHAAISVGIGWTIYLGYRDMFRANDPVAVPLWGTSF